MIDINGIEIKVGDRVKVHYDSGDVEAVVSDIFLDRPTVNRDGVWVDINTDDGKTGIMSYLLEVTNKLPLNASEAVFGFAAWLSTRKEVVSFGASCDCASIPGLITRFCNANSLGGPSINWPHNLNYPDDVWP